MYRSQLVVLKFGGSVLCGEDELPTAIHEIYRWNAMGYRVVAVVSALGTTTNQLFEQSRKYGQRLSPSTVAKLAATGESTSAALLGLALDRVGLSNEVHDENSLGIVTSGPILDAQIESVDAARFADAFERVDVVICPGFLGRNGDGRVSLLGRGGSDLTALFLADALDADHCRLIKDVDGLFEWDPKRSGSPRQYSQITYDGALELDESIVQHKAVRFAQEHGVEFEVTSLRSAFSTKVGAVESDQFHDDSIRPRPLRVGLLGLGTVGLGLYRHLSKFPSVKITRIAVRDLQKAIDNGAPESIVTINAVTAIQDECDVLIELIGGVEPALTLVRAALDSGKHVITANKSLIARHGAELQQIADKRNVRLMYSGAVGGGVPMIETVSNLSLDEPIKSVQGVMNGTCNFVLDKMAQDVTFKEAVLAAQRKGFAEADPSLDLNGTDAAEKLVILARSAGLNLETADVQCEALDESAAEKWKVAKSEGQVLRQVSSLAVTDSKVEASVKIQALEKDDFLAQAYGEDNRLVVGTESNEVRLIGRGAGRFPTSQAVVNDLMIVIRMNAGRRELQPV